mmetsp:Transcript_21727/g.41618  ORF Transcript_21727/g.41618 Transcript_21727/m.41618 type:complete len:83 (-) Transcript_21727:95-343(-)
MLPALKGDRQKDSTPRKKRVAVAKSLEVHLLGKALKVAALAPSHQPGPEPDSLQSLTVASVAAENSGARALRAAPERLGIAL